MWKWRQVGVRAVNTRHRQGIVKLVCPQVSIRQFILSPLAMHCEAAVTGEVLPRLWVSFFILLLTSLCIYFPSCTTYRSLEVATQTSRDSLTQRPFWLYTQTFTHCSTPIFFSCPHKEKSKENKLEASQLSSDLLILSTPSRPRPFL